MVPDRGEVIANIQLLRAAAAIAVVLYHLREWIARPGLSWNAGQAGVDVFFVISGFIIGLITRVERGAAEFALNRITRVVPLYWLLTLLIFAAAQVVPVVLGGHRPSPYELMCSLLFIPYTPPLGVKAPIIFLGWTLNYEMFFYAVFALAMTVAYRARIAVTAGVLVALVGVGLLHDASSPIAQTYLNPLLLEFVAGMGLSVAWQRRDRWLNRIGRPSVDMAVGIIAALCVVTIVISERVAPDAPRVLLWGAPAVGIVAAALWSEARGLRAARPAVLLLGASSYALYLIHPFVIRACAMASEFVGGVPAPLVAAAAFVAALVSAIFVHKLVERPMTRVLRRRIAR